VLLKVEARGVNYIDIYQRTGVHQVPLPATPGSEGAGTVIRTGPGVDGLPTGDRIAARCQPDYDHPYVPEPSLCGEC
jgi:NADPH2:quinone reductase